MADDSYDYEDEEIAPKKRDNLFIWTVLILILIGLAFACWLGSFYIFGHPEQARNYRILQRVKKIEPPKRFERTKAPAGDYLSAKALFDKYGKYSTLQLENENAELMRTFVTNYRETKKLVPYMRGNFTIADSAVLTAKDFITSGMVALGQANDFPQVLIEHIYPMNAGEIAKARPLLMTGNPIKLEKTYDFGAIVHIERVADGRLQFTVVPLTYESYALSGGAGTFATEPPADLHIEKWPPVMDGSRVAAALAKFTEYRRGQPAPEPGTPGDAVVQQGPQLVRLETLPEGAKVPETGALPEMPVATPIPIAGRGAPTPRRTMLASTATPLPIVGARPTPTMPNGVLKPFLESNPEPGLPGAQGNAWRTYKSGGIPAGNAIMPGEAAAFADRGVPPPRTYLRGSFYVSATGENGAVLRPRNGSDGAGTVPVRIIVKYVNGTVPPVEGTEVDRAEGSAFEVRDVRRGADGQINITVREIVEQ